ncbi:MULTISPECIES: AsmA family protein [unclassified Photobacterium]|uniref:AsmA family protein n=1 Tax=unclassified Photobacterium TaxID=2628852 RepID=UPI001EE0DB1D|nr:MULTISPECIES: AsmA family protein [unclassified Photobacterium]MCG3864327.1 AsmA family protein [Photobacterium sp. Ph6]MCG3875857.1 AsmA family protein [Photobacterium sp. Ph5]
MRWVIKLVASVLLLGGLSIAALIVLLQTRYATPLLNHTLAIFSHYQLAETQLHYDIKQPLQITLQPLTVKKANKTLLSVHSITLELSSRSLQTQHLIFSNVIIDGIDLHHQQWDKFEHLSVFSIDRLAINDLSIVTPAITINHAQLQIDNWQYRDHQQPWWQQFSGQFQLSAPQITWHNQTLENLLLNGTKQQQHWQLAGFSGRWQRANFNGTADYNRDTQLLTLDQLTLTNLRIQQSQPLAAWSQWLADAIPVRHIMIKRADILDTSIEQPIWAADDISLSLENWSWPNSYWQQDKAHLSVSASNAKWHDIVFEQPIIELNFMPEKINSQGISAQLLNGYMRMDGEISPDKVKLKKLLISGIKGFLPPQWLHTTKTLTSGLSELTIDNLDINNIQLTATDTQLPFQLAGINIDGNDVVLKHQHQWGLWQGKLDTSLGFASINQVVFTDPIAEMSSSNGDWTINKFVLPFTNGMLTADANIQLAQQGQPWSISISNDSVPAALIYRWFKLPLPLNGKIDGILQAQGLASNRQSFNYSLSGQADLTFRDIHLDKVVPTQLLSRWKKKEKLLGTELDNDNENSDSNTALTLLPLKITAERGKITIPTWRASNDNFSLSLTSDWDLAIPKQQRLEWVLKEDCQQVDRRWHADQTEVNSFSTCNGKIK